ncbi:hypothetical protein STAQ_33880 [Allostella sp. ATCC 35155]|nr:hypothetical protein STAQ_33880 [Stella sp. ATCC 35155]
MGLAIEDGGGGGAELHGLDPVAAPGGTDWDCSVYYAPAPPVPPPPFPAAGAAAAHTASSDAAPGAAAARSADPTADRARLARERPGVMVSDYV